MKKTKIICTLGPSSENEETIIKMAEAGMNVVRINFSHGTHEEHAKKIELIKKVRKEHNLPLPILLDTKGPEFRIKTFKNGKITLNEGDKFIFTAEDVEGDETRVSVNYKSICEEMVAGDKILLNNGLMSFLVDKVDKPNVYCTVLVGGELSNRKSMFFPDKDLHLTYLSEQDKNDLLFGIKHKIAFVACSFVSHAQDVIDVKNFLNANGGGDIDIIAKIENRTGVNNIEEILAVSDGIMIGRGDMGVEIPYEELPNIQKTIISKCRLRGKRVITATEMLESMIKQPRPTRAEISDVANAVYDGTSAIMLSGETAAGAYPVEAVKAMAKIAEQAEGNRAYIQTLPNNSYEFASNSDALSHSACTLAEDLGAKCLLVCSRTGKSARMVSRFRPMIDIIAMTTDENVYRKLALNWGITPILSDEVFSVDALFNQARILTQRYGFAKKGDTIVVMGGKPTGESGNSSMINIEKL